MRKINIFIDETGEFGFGKNSSLFYGISFTFHEQKDDISNELNNLNDHLNRIGYTNMIHMADLVMHRGDYTKMNIQMRKCIFNAIYQFARKIPVKFHTIIVNKKYTDSKIVLRKKLINEINKMIKEHEVYFNKFDQIVLYYDNGQEVLGNILDATFAKLNGYEHRENIKINSILIKVKNIFYL